jgi:hypothetical protein
MLKWMFGVVKEGDRYLRAASGEKEMKARGKDGRWVGRRFMFVF